MPVALAVAPHPDDEAYPFGGLLALLAGAGWRCFVLAATLGEAGERHDGACGEPLAMVRARELREACRLLGAEPPLLWRLPDGGLAGLPSRGEELARLVAELGAELLLSLGPDGAYGHPDHVAAHRWTREASERSGTALLEAVFAPRLFLPQYERCRSAGVLGDPPLLAPDQLGSGSCDIVLQLTPTLRSRKRAAIAAHRSQLPGGEPEALFPRGIVEALLDRESYAIVQGGPAVDAVRRLVRSLGA